MRTQKPNVVLICTDQWRGDCLSIAGHPTVHTPTLDALAMEGVRFSNAYTACPSCIASRASLFTGLAPCSHGRVGYQDSIPWDYETTLAGEFTRNGYQTQAIGKMHVYPPRSQTGFQNVILHDGFLTQMRREVEDPGRIDDYIVWLRRETGRLSADYFDHGINCNSWLVREWDKEEYLHPTNWVVSEGIDFLRRRDPRKPFFLFLSFVRPHPPFDPPRTYLEQYLASAIPDPPRGDWIKRFSSQANPWKYDALAGFDDHDKVSRARAGYYALITHIDHQINRFLETLEMNGISPQNTIIMFLSDHGELLGDHGLFRKYLPYE
ncbi:MAG TPA: sulfatase-like hydrolase/transferase, partial [Spirochaetia bacterium]|nr:sulfatase-like hydrolase/transferase [Spirochaetia bacterium]